MKCKACGGSGWDAFRGIECISCEGKGEIEFTNAEYMRQCDDASLAFEIWKLIKDGNTDSLYHIERWLKEEYHE